MISRHMAAEEARREEQMIQMNICDNIRFDMMQCGERERGKEGSNLKDSCPVYLSVYRSLAAPHCMSMEHKEKACYVSAYLCAWSRLGQAQL